MSYFTVSNRGRKGYYFNTHNLAYDCTMKVNGQFEDFMIHADSRQDAIAKCNIIVQSSDVQQEIRLQEALQQIKVAYRMIENGTEEESKVLDYIKRIKNKYNIEDASDIKSEVIETITTESIQTNTSNETPAQQTNDTTNTYNAYNRSFSSYDEAYTHCIESDFDPSYIQSETVSGYPLTLDLQHFASTPATRKLYESNYDTVKIITTSGEYIARIHPSSENEYQHNIFYSSDDSFSVNDNEIIFVSSIYKKSIITEHGIHKWGIGKGLDFAYTIETTKADPNIDDINYSNIHKYDCKSIQETLEWFNRYQKMGYHNISIQTNVNYKNNTIISDASECNIEIDINNQFMNDIQSDNKQLKKQMEQLFSELNDYKEFIKHYKAEKTFEQFKENKDNKEAS